VIYFPVIAIAASLFLLYAWYRQHKWSRRERAIRGLLDGADALEASLQKCRGRMQRLKTMLSVLPEEMSADANTALTADDKVQAALRDLLAHRLWIQQHASSATQGQLDKAFAAIEQSRRLMEAQLARLDGIAAELAKAQSSAQTMGTRDKVG
jgi:hypothetical protein